MSFVLISIILLSATALAAPAKDYTKVNSIEAPVAAFSASTTSGDATLKVQFTDESTGISTSTSWKWNFGDGKSSTDQNPEHTYKKAGKYTVSLTVKNAGGTDKIRKHNYITVYAASTPDKEAPVINSVSLSSTAPETGDLITVTVDVTDNVGISSVTASGISLVNTGGNIWEGNIVAEEGTHTISVTASDAAGNTAIDESASYTATTPDTSTAADPVCHMTVNKSTAKYTSVYDGTTYYFCSASCMEKFDANPENYINS
ncbi:hypothetical protein DU80_14585 [Methanosarcina mazei]|uniref:PKD domain-containing protein n=2 Tax=Methanosarcina TaxID=2207 RepID=A0A0F8RST4_METMZ|nr:hypothetical protein DU47_13660 [Methanosarcina mazei]KKH90528.1 hypothetical protein DU80_14585 [Methanosarcina mazei]